MSENDQHHEESERSEYRRGRGRGHHHEESERGVRGRRREHGEDSHHHEESERGGQRRMRVERGMLRYLLLDALQHGPKHGYEIIKWLEEQSYGRYVPSAGIVYPTLQLLEDQGLILAERVEEKSSYRLTETGEAELQTHTDFIKEFWERNGHPVLPATTLLAVDFVYDELQELQRTVEKGVRVLTKNGDQQSLLPLRQALERSKSEIRDLLTPGGTAPQAMSTGSHSTPVNAKELEEAIAQTFVSEDEALRQTLVRAKEQGLPSIQISALQGKLLQVLATACHARKILEIGALAGYSGIWLARALPADGRLITLEIDETHANVVRESFRQAKVDDRAEVRVGPALEILPLLTTEKPFDLIFIDADKDSYPQYLTWAIQLAHPGSIIVADNCVMGGNGLRIQDDPKSRYAGASTYNQSVSHNAALRSIALPVNTGMTISVVLDKTEQQDA